MLHHVHKFYINIELNWEEKRNTQGKKDFAA